MATIGIIGAGHPFKYQYQALKDLGYELVLCDKDLSKLSRYSEMKFEDYKKLINIVDAVLISTPPKTHFEIIKYFIENNIYVICEKPLVTNVEDLKYLKRNSNRFYNILHFSYGEEIEWFMKNGNLNNIKKIIATINDPYICNNKIKKESLSLHGAYLDETINPLSAISRIFNKVPKFINAKLKYYENDFYDYSSNSLFNIDNIPLEINVNWNDSNNREKYIDIYYEDYTLRLDSFNQQVINLNNDLVLYKFYGERMYRHYLNGFTDRIDTSFAININEAIMEYFKR